MPVIHMVQKIEFAEQDVIVTMKPLLKDFMRRVLDLELNTCFVSDETTLSDFSLNGLAEAGPDDSRSLEQRMDAWDTLVLSKVESEYGVRPKSTADTLVVILAAIDRHRKQQVQ